MRTIRLLIAALLVLAWIPDTKADVQVRRIVTIGGAVTETVFALGHGGRVVGVDQTSSFPPDVKGRPNVGYMRALSAEGVLSLAPTIIIATEGSGPPDVIAILRRAAIPFVTVPEGHDEAAVLRKVRLIAEVLGETERGEAMTRAIREDFAALAAQRRRIAERRRGIFVFAVGSGAPTVGGARTSADGIMALGGIENAMQSAEGFRPAVAESALAASPDVVITMSERNHGLDADTLFALPAFAGTPAARDRRVVSIPSSYLNFGPRAAHAANRLAAAVYPELALEALPPRPWTRAEAADRP